MSAIYPLVHGLVAQGGVELPAGIVSEYRFDEGSGQVLTDYAGTRNLQLGSTSGADTNDPTWQASPTRLYFTTDDNCILTGDTATNAAMTWVVLMRRDALAATQNVVNLRSGSSTAGNLPLRIDASGVLGVIGNGVAGAWNSSLVVPSEAVCAVASRMQDNAATVTVDASHEALASGTYTSQYTDKIFVGSSHVASVYYKGAMYWIGRWHRWLTDDEVAQAIAYARALKGV